MENRTAMGLNKTGIEMSPLDSKQLIDFARLVPPDIQGSDAANVIREDNIKEADPIGSIPLPANPRGLIKTLASKLSGIHIEMLVDKISERIAFERTGVRLYDAIITKFNAMPDMDNVISILQQFRMEEVEHLHIVINAMIVLGGDPTAETPGADVVGVASSGILKVISDPRTDAAQSLQALLTAELTDTASWELLVNLANLTEHNEFITNFNHALAQENNHQNTIKQLLLNILKIQSTM